MVFKYRLAEILLKLALNTNHAINQSINQSIKDCLLCVFFFLLFVVVENSQISLLSLKTRLEHFYQQIENERHNKTRNT